MAIELVTVRARTRGKSPQEFTYQGIGRLKPRKVNDKEGNPVKREDGSEVEVDDLEVEGLTSDVQDVLNLYGALPADVRNGREPLQMLIDYGLMGYNMSARDAASPVTEQVTEDELSPIIAAMKDAKILDDKTESVFRRTITSAAKEFEASRIDFVRRSPKYKALPENVRKELEKAA